jgi:hypothetical protein
MSDNPVRYTWSKLRRPFHFWTCRWADRIKDQNRRSGRVPEDLDTGEARRPCLVCRPPVREEGGGDATRN